MVFLNSPGGAIVPAIAIERMLRKEHARASVLGASIDPAICASACVLILAGAISRGYESGEIAGGDLARDRRCGDGGLLAIAPFSDLAHALSCPSSNLASFAYRRPWMIKSFLSIMADEATRRPTSQDSTRQDGLLVPHQLAVQNRAERHQVLAVEMGHLELL
jgi:hypothetical protein